MHFWIVSIITPVFSVTWTFRNYSTILNLVFKKHLLSILKTVVLLNIVVETMFFFQDSPFLFHIWIKNLLLSILITFNPSLLKLSINFFKKKSYWPQTFDRDCTLNQETLLIHTTASPFFIPKQVTTPSWSATATWNEKMTNQNDKIHQQLRL